MKKLIASLLPGIFLIGYNIGTGSVSSMSKAGANYGMTLLWAVLISCLATFYLMTLFSRYSMVTGETSMQGFRKHIHPAYALGLLVALGLIILTGIVGVLSIVSDVLVQWSIMALDREIPAGLWALIVSVFIYTLMWRGNTGLFERTLAVLVALMGLSFVISAVVSFPGWGAMAGGLIPQVPAVAEGSDNSAFVIIAGMIGTTVSVFVFLIRPGLVLEKGWGPGELKLERRDAAVSAVFMFVLSAAVLTAAAGTLHQAGFKFNAIAELIPVLEPVYGASALTVFVIGVVAAGMSSHLPNLLVIPWLTLDYLGSPRRTTSGRCRLVLLLLSIFAVGGVLMGTRPVFLMLLSQACIAAVLPLTLAGMFYLTSRKDLMGDYRSKGWEWIPQALLLLFSFYVSGLAIRGLIADLTSL
jgi:manganese transport protein